MSDLYFNGRLWRELLGNEQAVRFLEELYQRAGGSVAPVYNLSETVNQVTNVDNSSSEMAQDRSRRLLADTVRQLDDDNQQLRAQIKKLESRLNELENSL